MTTLTRLLRTLPAYLVFALLVVLVAQTTAFAAPLYSAQAPFAFTGSPSCPSPPAGFDPATASAAQLQFYGMPRRPTGNAATVAHWASLMRRSTQHVCTPEVKGPAHDSRIQGLQAGGSTSSSTVWSGMVATNGGFNWVFSDWTVPTYTSSSSSQRLLEWIGIGGYGSSKIWQTGTETDSAEGYRFWYEDYPNDNIIYAGPAITHGSQVAAQVDYNYTFSNASYLYVSNYSNGQYWSTHKSFQPSQNSADWVIERTQCGGGNAYALTSFNSFPWTYSQAQSTSVSGDNIEPISAFSYVNVTMSSGGTTLAHASGLGSDGKSFTSYWNSHGSSTC